MKNPIDKLMEGNKSFIANDEYAAKRALTATRGQKPHTVVVTCSDSRVTPEFIFSANIGELFVVRTAGLTLDNFAIGSIEFAVSTFESKVIIVLGHNSCGAVAAAAEGKKHTGKLRFVTREISLRICGAENISDAERLNVMHACNLIQMNPVVKSYLDRGEVEIIPAIYDLYTGKVEFLFGYE